MARGNRTRVGQGTEQGWAREPNKGRLGNRTRVGWVRGNRERVGWASDANARVHPLFRPRFGPSFVRVSGPLSPAFLGPSFALVSGPLSSAFRAHFRPRFVPCFVRVSRALFRPRFGPSSCARLCVRAHAHPRFIPRPRVRVSVQMSCSRLRATRRKTSSRPAHSRATRP